MSYRIYRIRGRTSSARQARLESTRRWMARRGWRLVDYAEGAGQAMFERDPALPEPGWRDADRWRLPPGYVSGVLEEWLRPRHLAFLGLVVAAALLIAAFNSLITVPTGTDPEAERWWRVTADALNVRAEPTTGAEVVGILYRDQKVLVGEPREDGWIEVVQPERGFVARDFLTPPGAAAPEEGSGG